MSCHLGVWTTSVLLLSVETLAVGGPVVWPWLAGQNLHSGGWEDEEEEGPHLPATPGDWAGLVRYHVQLLLLLLDVILEISV